jgi:hypothetical protein
LTYQIIFPGLKTLFVSQKIESALVQSGIDLRRNSGPQVFSPHFTEPSLVYYLGSDIILGDKADAPITAGLKQGDILLFNVAEEPLKDALEKIRSTQCFKDIATVNGFNYSKGDAVEISIVQKALCAGSEGIIIQKDQP